jgi:hypothetical protein
MNTNCVECSRLLERSNDALKCHTVVLGRIYVVGNDQETVMQMLSEPEVQEAVDLRNRTRRAFTDHYATHNEEAFAHPFSIRRSPEEIRTSAAGA